MGLGIGYGRNDGPRCTARDGGHCDAGHAGECSNAPAHHWASNASPDRVLSAEPASLSSLVASTTQQILRSVAMRPAEPAPARTPCPPGSRVERVAAALHRAYYRGACGPFSQASEADRERFAALAVVTLDGPADAPAPPLPRAGEPGTNRGNT